MKILHILNKLDTVESIAKIYNVSTQTILNYNHITNLDPLPSKLEIPINNEDFVVVNNFKRNFLLEINAESDLKNIRSNLLKQGFKAENDKIENENKILFLKQKSNVYVVGVLENLDSICKKFALKKEEVIKKNNLKSERLFIGQMLEL